MIHLSTSLSYYKRPEIQRAILSNCEGREVAIRFGDSFGKRPDVLVFPSDVLEMAKNGATSFHVSEEHWDNPLVLNVGMSRKDLDSSRIGWDLILDIDAKNLNISKLIAFLLVSVLEDNGIKGYSIKYSGNKGFHIGLGFEAFPEIVGGRRTSDSFPEIPKKIASYLIVEASKKISVSSDNIVFGDVKTISFSEMKNLLGSDFDKVFEKEEESSFIRFNPHNLINLDTVLISSRHMYRCAYSLHEKTGLVSLPISKDELLSFDKKYAIPTVVKGDMGFLDSVVSSEGVDLIIRASDSLSELTLPIKTREKRKYNYSGASILDVAADEIYFPPCINKILDGLEDGRKRGLFIVINFLRSLGWSKKSIESRVSVWNSSNKEPLSEGYVLSQIKYSFDKKNPILPPNCDNSGYYQDMGVKCSDDVCCKVKNPVVFSSRKIRLNESSEKKHERKNNKKEA